jgi:hypothetical protein
MAVAVMAAMGMVIMSAMSVQLQVKEMRAAWVERVES